MNTLDYTTELSDDLVLTTIDNPYNPKEEYDKWRDWDVHNGYNTEEVFARFADIPVDVDMDDDVTIAMLTKKALIEFIENDMTKLYKLI